MFIRTGPAALPIGSGFKVSLTSSDVTMIESCLYMVFFTVEAVLVGIHQSLFSEEVVQDVCYVLFLSVDLSILIQWWHDISLIRFDKMF